MIEENIVDTRTERFKQKMKKEVLYVLLSLKQIQNK